MKHCYYGPEYSDATIEAELKSGGLEYGRLGESELVDRTARELVAGKIVGFRDILETVQQQAIHRFDVFGKQAHDALHPLFA